ncbi:MAG: c-type cytochrome [Paracoccaceae bacterium]
MRLLRLIAAIAFAGIAIFWLATIPKSANPDALAGLVGDPDEGEAVFNAAGCASCHSAPGAEGAAKLELAGGRSFVSAFGTFYAPNISPDMTVGIGDWNASDLVNALQNGISKNREHLYPAFPYTTYTRMTLADIVSLDAYLKTLPSVSTLSKPHDVGFPFNIRRSLGGWKMLFLREGWVMQDVDTAQLERGRYLVEALGHCGECHTPRNILGGLQTSKWLSGAPNPSGKGTIPNITPGALSWSEDDLMAYFTSGFTPEFDTVGGEMVEVVDNLSKMSPDDLSAIIAYLKAVPAITTK